MPRTLLAVTLALTLCASARADNAKPGDQLNAAAQDRPWARGVSPEKQKQAIDLFLQGNSLIKESLFKKAVDAYKSALEAWDHPAIHYNLALALLNLDQPVEVFHHLEKALAYGQAPLDEEKFEHARSYKLLIEKQVTHLTVSCQESGALVTLDGTRLFTAPGSYDGWVRSGQHNIVASKEGYISSEKTEELKGGVPANYDLKLYSSEELTRYKHRWPVWMPYLVLGAGVVVAAMGGVLYYLAQSSVTDFDNGIKACGGCIPSPTLTDERDNASRFSAGAIVAFGVGGAVAAAGVTLAILNRAQPYQVSPNERDHLGTSSVSFAPMLGPNTAGAFAVGHF
jgi:hypothetical protein